VFEGRWFSIATPLRSGLTCVNGGTTGRVYVRYRTAAGSDGFQCRGLGRRHRVAKKLMAHVTAFAPEPGLILLDRDLARLSGISAKAITAGVGALFGAAA